MVLQNHKQLRLDREIRYFGFCRPTPGDLGRNLLSNKREISTETPKAHTCTLEMEALIVDETRVQHEQKYAKRKGWSPNSFGKGTIRKEWTSAAFSYGNLQQPRRGGRIMA
jgi:hypothetical protein